MNYIYFPEEGNNGYVVQPTMGFSTSWKNIMSEEGYNEMDRKYRSHIASLPRIYLAVNPDWENERPVGEGQVRLQWQWKYANSDKWEDCSYSDFHETPGEHRQVAYPVAAVEKETEMPRCDYELFVEHYFGLSKNTDANQQIDVTYSDLVDLVCAYDQKIKAQK